MFKTSFQFVSSNAKYLIAGMTVLWVHMINFAVCVAGEIGTSKLATGTEQLIKDATSWLLVVAPLVTIVAVIYYFIRKAIADEMDHRKWNTRITTAILCCIGVVAASLIINIIIGYYQ